ncbi:MAG TPA: carboxypeptidase regulatory-like domain-containing protein [Kofleriaceae bacterium]|jgi:plastocyanin|nr:carboxypeptidase regulatory-like domain-containing protein [Kofleriaceae bacterium]
MRLCLVLVLAVMACGPKSKPRQTTPAGEQCFYDCGDSKTATADAGNPSGVSSQPAAGPAKPAGKLTPAGEKAALLRQAADLLDKAGDALAGGNKNLAENLFSTAELLVGADAVASLAPQFREGAPPRVTGPTKKFDTNVAAQARAVGSSEEEDEEDKVPPPPKADVGTLTGTLQIDGKPLTGAFGLVTLEPANGKWKPRPPKPHVMAQRGREFNPHIMAISVGSTVEFPNFDTVFHNVFSTSPQAAFDLGIYKQGEAREYKFDKEGIIRLGCNLHANMSAYLVVVSAPAYVVTDDKGNFKFGRLAPGKYKLKAWSEKSKQPITQDITIKTGANTVNVGVAADAPAGPPPDKFGGKR